MAFSLLLSRCLLRGFLELSDLSNRRILFRFILIIILTLILLLNHPIILPLLLLLPPVSSCPLSFPGGAWLPIHLDMRPPLLSPA